MAPGIPLAALQGNWVASRGEAVQVRDKELSINGKPVPGGLKLSEDGGHVVGFSIYKPQANEITDGRVLWHAGPQEIIWRRADAAEVSGRIERMTTAIDRQGEGLAAAANSGGVSDFDGERKAVARLNALIERWRVGPLMRVRSCDICPDWTNRAQTGLSVDHIHYIATKIATDGFKSRRRGLTTAQGAHDVPVLIRESRATKLGRSALKKWHEHTKENPLYPPFLLEGKREFYCSLGNGHFSQALNLFRLGAISLWSCMKYNVGEDSALREALDEGVESVVLSGEMPEADRRFVSEMLNRAHGRHWHVGNDGRVTIDGDIPAISGSQFVALSKVLDAEELSCLVRQKLGVDVDRTPMAAATTATTPAALTPVAVRSRL